MGSKNSPLFHVGLGGSEWLAKPHVRYRVSHLAFAALRADSARSSGVMVAARALPPLTPPLRPSATAAGSFLCSGFFTGRFFFGGPEGVETPVA